MQSALAAMAVRVQQIGDPTASEEVIRGEE